MWDQGDKSQDYNDANDEDTAARRTFGSTDTRPAEEPSQRRSATVMLDFTGIPRPTGTSPPSRRRSRLDMEESSHGSDGALPIHLPPRQLSECSIAAGNTSEQEQSGCSYSGATAQNIQERRSTLDLVLQKRYPYETYERGRVDPGNFSDIESRAPRSERAVSQHVVLEATTGILLDGSISTQWMQQYSRNTVESQEIRKNATIHGKHSNVGCWSTTGDGSVSTAPDPPSLHQREHYTPPGAFRMRSGEMPRCTNDDAESFIDSVTSYPKSYPHGVQYPFEAAAAAMVEASLVHEDPIPDDECPPELALANYTSIGDRTKWRNTTIPADATAAPAYTIVEAQPMEEGQSVRDFFWTRKVQCALLVTAAVFVVLALGTAYGLNGFSKQIASEDNGGSQGSPPTHPPTSEGDLDLEFFTQVALPDYTRVALRRENAPQKKALRWLKNNTFLESYDMPRRMQRFALATFYFSTSGDRRWDNKTGWLSDDDECTWFFSTQQDTEVFYPCDDNMVTRLSMADNNMRGTVPMEISFLTSLEVLEMPGNVLTGFLPTTLGRLSLLRSIHLFDNFLSGTIPSEVGDATSLEILSVEYNLLAQILPETLGRLTNLKQLLLDRNIYRGTIPFEFTQLSQLETFHLFSNSLSGTIPPEIGYLSNLQSVRWEVNRLSGSVPTEIGLWRNVDFLSLGNNTLSGTIPSEIGTLSYLTYMDMFDNKLSGKIPTMLGRLTNAEQIYLEQNQLQGSIPTEFGNLRTSLRKLWLYSNTLTGAVPSEIGQLTNMKNLDLSFNDLSGTLPTELGSLANMEKLSLEYNGFTGAVPSELGLLSKLTLLALHGNDFTGIVPAEICLLKLFGKLSTVVADCSWLTCACCICSSDFNY